MPGIVSVPFPFFNARAKLKCGLLIVSVDQCETDRKFRMLREAYQ